MPVGKNLVRGLGQFLVRFREGGIHHRQFVGVCADGFQVAVFRDQAVRRSYKGIAKPLGHRLNAPVLPKERMAPPGSEVRDGEALEVAESFDLFPGARHCARVKNFQLELAEIPCDGS